MHSSKLTIACMLAVMYGIACILAVMHAIDLQAQAQLQTRVQ